MGEASAKTRAISPLEKKQVSMATSVELMHECSRYQLRMGTARMNKTNTQRKKVRRKESEDKDNGHEKPPVLP